MIDRRVRQPWYETSLDRVGWALATGGLIGGAIAATLAAMSGGASVAGVVLTLIAGTVMTALAIAALAVLPWIALHASGRRGPVSAALLGAAIGFVVFLFGLTYGFGLDDAVVLDPRTLFFRWASGIATSVVLATITAGIGVAMWRVAYRRAD